MSCCGPPQDAPTTCCPPSRAATAEPTSDKREAVYDAYEGIADGTTTGCCGSSSGPIDSKILGYSEAELKELPSGADLGQGCGAPHERAAYQPGEVVVDLGSGGGIDCFIAAPKVGAGGKVIGVEMGSAMLKRARTAAASKPEKYGHVEFRLGEIEHLPVADNTADVIISNCVINLTTDKVQVLKECYRILKPGGRLAISDTVALQEMPAEVKKDDTAWCACISGALSQADYLTALHAAGFNRDARIETHDASEAIAQWGKDAEKLVTGAIITATKS